MTEEFSEKSDGSVQLKVIFEGDPPPGISLPHVEFIKFNHPWHHVFLRKFGHLQEAHGVKFARQSDQSLHAFRDFKFDAIRFSFKIFAVLQALSLFRPDQFFAWIDADVRCIKSFNQFDLFGFFPDEHQIMSYLGRTNFPPTGAYSECGFLGFNARHPQTISFLNRMAEIYKIGRAHV